MLRTAPFVGNPSVDINSTYNVSRDGNGNVSVRIRSEGPASHLQFDGTGTQNEQYLDRNRSNVEFDISLEVDAQEYSVKVTGMNYEYRLVPGDPP